MQPKNHNSVGGVSYWL